GAGAERVFNVLDEPVEAGDEATAKKLTHVRGQFTFDDLSFSYDKQTPVLKNINLQVEPGQTVAFVGHTGAGKSTIIHLISRFYTYDSGRIILDGVEIHDLSRASLREHMAVVLQDP